MKAIELIGDVDEQHRLHAQVPTEIPVGQVRLIMRELRIIPGAVCSLTRRRRLLVSGPPSSRESVMRRLP